MGREENEAVVRAYSEAGQRGDVAALVRLYADDVTLHYFGRSPYAGDHVGKPAAVKMLTDMQKLTNRKLLEVHDVLSGDDHGAMLSRERWERDGKVLDVRRVFVYHLRGGQISEAWAFDDDQRAVDEFWT